jgi:hypothetical protein
VLAATLVALAVLVHHGATARTDTRHLSRITDAAMTEPGAGHLVAAPHASHSGTAGPAAHGDASAGPVDNAMNCGKGVLQHCGAATVTTTELPPPKATFRASTARHAVASRATVTALSAERAPPELSALSQLRI